MRIQPIYFKYTRNKILFFLSIFLIIAIYTTIRYCTYPLLINHPLFVILFTSTSTDSTLYDISLGYIASYIFYAVQVYIPDYINNQKGLNTIRPMLIKEITLIDKLIKIYEETTQTTSQSITICNTNPIYIIENTDDKSLISKFTFKDSYQPIKEQLLTLHSNICGNPSLSLVDANLIHLLAKLPLESTFRLMDNIYKQINENDRWDINNNNSISKLQDTRNKLCKICKISPDTSFSITTSPDHIKLYNNAISTYRNLHESELKVSLKRNISIING